MKQPLTLSLALCGLLAGFSADAKIWRLNNTVGANADFSNANAAVTAAAAGDTIYVEGSNIDYGVLSLNKRLVIRGTGYFLSDATPNPKTQHNKNGAYFNSITLDAGSKGSVIEGLSSGATYLRDSLVTYQRNWTNYLYLSDTRNIAGDTLRHNYFNNGIYLSSGSYKVKGLFIYNNIVAGSVSISPAQVANADGYVINNTFLGNNSSASANFIYQNNIFNDSNFGIYQSSNTFLNNVSVDANLPAGSGNITGATIASLYVSGISGAGFSSDGRYVLKAGSPAIGAGVLNGVTVDCGAFGGPAPYVLSGMPQMPSIYDINMPATVNLGTSSISVSISAAAH